MLKIKYQILSQLKKLYHHTAMLSSTMNPEVFFNHQAIDKQHETFELNTDIFKDRRSKLMDLIAQKCVNKKTVKNHLVLIPSGTKTFMSENIPYYFRQNTDFSYLSGVKEPDTLLLLRSVQGKSLPYHSSVLFIPKSNENTERWEGKKMTINDVINNVGIDEAYYMDELENYLHSYFSNNYSLMVWYNCLSMVYPKINNMIRDLLLDCNVTNVDTPHPLIQRLRLIKSKSEIKLLKKSCQIASEALSDVMTFSYPSILESHLQAKMEFECRIRGAENLAFPPVVAGGDRANTIHYSANNQKICHGETILMDAGCEFQGYCSDITRTWPVSGKFTNAQRDLYEVILTVQEELFDACKSFPTLDHLFQTMCNSMGKKFQEVGLIPITASTDEASKAAYNFCPHHVSHYLGMDVHDTSSISRGINIEPGMVITIEPGVYIKSNDERVPSQYRGLCVRIEDDVLITENGPVLLTSQCPRQVEDIEKLLSSRT